MNVAGMIMLSNHVHMSIILRCNIKLGKLVLPISLILCSVQYVINDITSFLW